MWVNQLPLEEILKGKNSSALEIGYCHHAVLIGFPFLWAARLRKFVCNADHKLKKKINDSLNVSQNFAIRELLPKIAFDLFFETERTLSMLNVF